MKPSALSNTYLVLPFWLVIAACGCAGSHTTLTGAQARLTDREVTVKLAPKSGPPPLIIDIVTESAHAKPDPSGDCPAPVLAPRPTDAPR